MDIEEIREYCLCKNGTVECFPFDETTLVFKVGNKMFALMSIERPFTINLKCNPEKAVSLRNKYEFVTPGYHMNKVHWNTISLEECNSDKLLLELIDHSYDLVVCSLSKLIRDQLLNDVKKG